MLISTNEENRVYLPLKCLYAVCVHRIDFDLSKQSASGPIITAGSKKGQRDISEEFSQGGGATPWASPGAYTGFLQCPISLYFCYDLFFSSHKNVIKIIP